MPLPDPAQPERPDFAALFAALPVAALIVDPADRIASANMLAEQMLNVSERVMAGQPLSAVLPLPGDDAGQGGSVDFNFVLVTSRGVRLRVDLAQGAIGGHPGWRAITLHPSAGTRGLGSSHRGAQAAVGAAAMLAHEIKNPLCGIRGAAQLLGRGELTELIITEVDRIAALIDGMQQFGDARPLAVAAENIYPLLAHARVLAEAGVALGMRIEERYDPSLPAALVNRDALLQILINLLNNAGEAVGDVSEPRIAITTAYRHGITRTGTSGQPRMSLPIEVCVIDNGPGAPADIADHLFEPFVSGRPEGQGLGLALVHKLIGDMGGLVTYAREGEPAVTVLRMLLPRAAG